jgi:two-component system, cell cycle sensor histidine kinase and response regulator CckA
VESVPGHGATFIILLPALDTVATPVALEAKRSTTIAGRRILVMDDQAMFRDVMVSQLRRRGADVTAVPGGDPAVAAYAAARAEGHAFDLVILDLTIPGEPGGKDVVVRLRAIDPSVRAVAISGYSDDPVMARPTGFGFVGSLRKPHTSEELDAALQTALNDRS